MLRQLRRNYLNIFLLLALFYSFSSFSYSIHATDSSTHYRLTVEKETKQVEVSKIEDVIYLNGNKKVLDNILSWFRNNNFSKKYIKGVALNKDGRLNIKVSSKNVEAFSFVRKADKNLIIDFWINDQKGEKVAVKKDVVKLKQAARKKIKNKKTKSLVRKEEKKIKVREYRDFRYGLNFLWDYKPSFPEFKKFVEVKRKTPLFFYDLKQRDYEKNEQEAHMQLTINLFNKDKWGLMNKSIELYYKKYGKDKNEALNEFLRVNALIKNNYLEGETKPQKELIRRLEELELVSDEFLLSKAILKYVFQYYIDSKDYISSLKIGKKLFVLTKEDYDTEGLVESLQGIIYSLSQLNQYDKIFNLLEDKEVEKYLDKIQIAEYRIYNLVLDKKYPLAIGEFDKIKKSIIDKIPSSILFNVAESYFGQGDYKQALKFYDEFVQKYSFDKKSSHSRLRIALCYDLLEKDEGMVQQLYRDAIDRSANSKIRYEASLRYFGFEYLRKLKERKDELSAFLEPPVDVESNMTQDLLKAKWQMRMRKFILDGEYENALVYLKKLPMEKIKPEERSVFRKDGAAALTYKMSELFKNKKYSELIQLHETVNKVLTDEHVYFYQRHELLGMSYYQMNIENSYKKIMDMIKNNTISQNLEYPRWKKIFSVRNRELSLLKLFYLSEIKKENFDGANFVCYKIKKIDRVEGLFCQAKTNYSFSKYKEAKKYFENIISEFYQRIEGTDFNQEVSYYYLMSLYKLRYFDKFVEIVQRIDREKAFTGMSKLNIEELKYLYFETIYSNPSYPLLGDVIESMNEFSLDFPNSRWVDRVKYLHASSLIKVGEIESGKKELDRIITTTNKEYIRDLARSELSSIILNNKKI